MQHSQNGFSELLDHLEELESSLHRQNSVSSDSRVEDTSRIIYDKRKKDNRVNLESSNPQRLKSLSFASDLQEESVSYEHRL